MASTDSTAITTVMVWLVRWMCMVGKARSGAAAHQDEEQTALHQEDGGLADSSFLATLLSNQETKVMARIGLRVVGQVMVWLEGPASAEWCRPAEDAARDPCGFPPEPNAGSWSRAKPWPRVC